MNDEEVKHRRMMMMANEMYDESESRDGHHHHHLNQQQYKPDIKMRKREWLLIISFLKAIQLLSTPIIDMRMIKAADVRR